MNYLRASHYRRSLSIILSVAIACVAIAQDEELVKAKAAQKKAQDYQRVQMMMSQLSWIANNPMLMEELEIADSQIEDLKKAGQEYQRATQKHFAKKQEDMMEIQKLFQEGKRKEAMEKSMEFQQAMFDIAKSKMDEVEKSLLPHQLARMKQIALQQTMKFQNPYGDEFGLSLGLAAELRLNQAEKAKLDKVIREARQRYYEETKRLKQQAKQEILAALPPEKQQKLQEMLGDIYDFDEAQRVTASQYRKVSAKPNQEKSEAKDKKSD